MPTPLVVKSKTSTKNAIGKVISMNETLGGTLGGTINYTYFANGNLKTTSFGGATTTITQDAWGRKKQLDDPSAGTYQYTYNDFGETLTETVRASGTTTTPGPGAIKGITTYTIDNVGKVSQKTIIGQNGDNTNSRTTYTYDATDKLLKAMRFDDITAGNYTTYDYQYDNFKRPTITNESSFQAFFQTAKQYDLFGRVEKELYTAINTSDNKRSDKWIRYTYKNGYQWQIIDDATNKVLRQIYGLNFRGQLISASNGTNTYDYYGYDIFGLQTYKNVIEFTTGGTLLLNLTTSFDPQRGNLISRSNPFSNATESITYDNQDRLLTYPNEFGVTQTQNYDIAGKITSNNIGDYAYSNAAKPYQLTSITPTDQSASSAVLNYYTNRTQDINYNVFKSPVSIMEQGKENIYFEYNAFNQRSTMYCGGLQSDKNTLPVRKFYNADGSMEIKRVLPSSGNPGYVEFTTFIGGDGYSAPIMLKSDGTTQNYLYLHRDYQGSIIAVTNDAGKVLQKQFFDPWGKISNYLSYVCLTPGCPTITYIPTSNNDLRYTDRGYTGHELLLGVGLINMNARLYDPKLHRFLEPDNFVQDPSNTQNYNRYGYCWNNPLAHTDPSGEWIVAALAIYGLFFTDAGYEVQKYISPIAFKVDLKFGTHQNGIGFDISYGIPKAIPFSYRESYGATYFTKTYGDYEGWETRKGVERSFLWFYHTGHTNYTSGEFSQTVGFKSFGIPHIAGFTTSNDLWGDKGDRYRTAHGEINFLGFRLGLSLFTGDPGSEGSTKTENLGGNQGDSRNGTYVKNPYGDPDRHRSGVLYAGFGPINIGIDNEYVRDLFQNKLVHDRYSNTAHFRYLYGRGNNFFFQFGGSGW